MLPYRSPTDTRTRVRVRHQEKEPLSSQLSKQCPCLCPHSILQETVQENSGPTSEPIAYFRHPLQSFLISYRMSPSALPATQKCRAPRPTNRPKRATCHTCYTCHAKCRWTSPSATPAPRQPTTKPGPVPWPRATNGPQAAPPDPAQCHQCTPAMQNVGACRQVPRLPHAIPSATPATQSAAPPQTTNGRQARHQTQPSGKCHACRANMVWTTPATQRWCVAKLCVTKGWKKMMCDKVVCQRWCVTKGWKKMMCDKVVCERWCM